MNAPVSEHKDFCKLCPIIKTVLTKTNPAKMLADRFLRGPEDFIPATLNKDPLAILQVNELGPLYLGNRNGYIKVWVLIAVKIVM